MSKRNIVHIEIPTQDGKESAAFYKKLFGWEIQRDEELDYTMFAPQEGPGGGFSQVGETVKPNEVLIYVSSDDIQADLEKAKELGGTVVMEKSEIPNTGWFGMFKDPTGNTIGLYTSMNRQFNQ